MHVPFEPRTAKPTATLTTPTIAATMGSVMPGGCGGGATGARGVAAAGSSICGRSMSASRSMRLARLDDRADVAGLRLRRDGQRRGRGALGREHARDGLVAVARDLDAHAHDVADVELLADGLEAGRGVAVLQLGVALELLRRVDGVEHLHARAHEAEHEAVLELEREGRASRRPRSRSRRSRRGRAPRRRRRRARGRRPAPRRRRYACDAPLYTLSRETARVSSPRARTSRAGRARGRPKQRCSWSSSGRRGQRAAA